MSETEADSFDYQEEVLMLVIVLAQNEMTSIFRREELRKLDHWTVCPKRSSLGAVRTYSNLPRKPRMPRMVSARV